MQSGFSRFRFLVPLAIIGLISVGLFVMVFLVLLGLLAAGVGASPLAVLAVIVGALLLVGLAAVGWRLMRYGEFRPRWSKAYLQISGIFGILLFLGAFLSASPALTSLGFALLVMGVWGVLFGVTGYLYGGGRETSTVT